MSVQEQTGPSPAAPPERTFRAAYARTRRAQKSGVGAGAWSRWVNRPLGRVFAAAAYRVGATPNQVTVVSTVVTLASIAGVAVTTPRWWSSVLLALALVLGYALDSADGQLARLRGGGSIAGEWLDHVTDAVKTSAVHLAVLICWYRSYDTPRGWLLVPVAYTLVAAVFFFAVIRAEMLRRMQGRGTSRRGPAPAGRAPVLRSLLVLPADYGVLCVALALLPAERLFTGVYTALLAFAVFFLVGGLRNWFVEMRSFAAA